MKIFKTILILLICFSNPYAISNSLAEELKQSSSLQQENLWARAFCQNTSGAVTETGIRHIYICCYSGKQKCLINDVLQGHSRLIQISNNELESEENI